MTFFVVTLSYERLIPFLLE